MSADFKPELGALKSLRPFVFWAQTTLPTVFDDSLSYYEVLTKLTKMVNTLLENTDTTEENVEALATAYDELQAYVNDYFENLDVTTEIDNKLEEWRSDGIIEDMVDSYVAPIIHDYLYGADDEGGVQKTLEDMLADATESLNNALSTFSSDSRQALNDFERDSRDALTDFEDATGDALDAIPTTVDAWLEQNFTNPSSPPLDATLSLENAAAQSKATGERCDQLEDLVLSNNDWINSVSEVLSNQYVVVNNDGTNPRIANDASSDPLRPMSVANITGGRSYLISCVGNTVGPNTFSPAYAICNLSYDLQDEPVYTILDFYPRSWDPQIKTYEIIRSKSVYIPETIGLQTVNCLILMGNTDITVTPKCGVLSVKTDNTLTDPLLPANSKAVGDALANKLPWPVTEGQKDLGTDGKVLLSNGDGTTRWDNTGGDYDQEIAELQNDVSDLKSSLSGGTFTVTKTYMSNNRYSTNRIYNAETYNIGRKLSDIYSAQTANAFAYMLDVALSKSVSVPVGTSSSSQYGMLAFDENDICVWVWRNTSGHTAGDVVDFVLPANAVKMLCVFTSTLNNLGTEYVVTVVSDSLKNSIIYSDEPKFEKLQLVRTSLVPGFVQIDGSIGAVTTAEQRTTDYIPVVNGDTFKLSISYPTANTLWAAYACYDSKKNFISPRVVLINNVQTEGYAEFTVTSENAKYIRVSYNTFGTATAALYCYNNTDILYGLSDESKTFNTMQNGYVNKNIRDIGHRGYYSYPENTIPSFVKARKAGYMEVETDIRFTSDGVAVLLHDAEINRTARNADGSAISNTINIADITYEQALTYDFGIYKGDQFAGTKIPTLTEFLTLCKKVGLFCWLELKAGTYAQIQEIVDTVYNYGMSDHVAWTSAAVAYLTVVKEYDETAELCLAFQGTYPDTALESLKTGKNIVEGSVNVSGGNLASIVASAQADKIPLYFWTISNYTQLNNSFYAYATGYFAETLIPPSYYFANGILNA